MTAPVLRFADVVRDAALATLGGTCRENAKCAGETGHPWCVERRRSADALSGLAEVLTEVEEYRGAGFEGPWLLQRLAAGFPGTGRSRISEPSPP